MTTAPRGAAESCFDAAARYLAGEPGAVLRALAAHRAATDGRCLGCGQASIRWPCAVATSAQRALPLLPADERGVGRTSRGR